MKKRQRKKVIQKVIEGRRLTWRERDWFANQVPMWAQTLAAAAERIVDAFMEMGKALGGVLQKMNEMRIEKEVVDSAELDQGSVGDVHQESDL